MASIEETNGAIGYRADLTEHLIELNNSSAIAQAQQADPTVDVFTGLPFRYRRGDCRAHLHHG